MQNHVRKKKMRNKWRFVVLRILWHFCGCFEKHSMGKHKENLKIWHFLQTFIIFELFLPLDWSSICFEDGSLLLTLRSVPAATKCCCVLKHSWPRTSGTAMWASLIVAGPYFLAFLSGACHLVSRCVAQQLDSNNSVDLPRGPSVVAYISIAA